MNESVASTPESGRGVASRFSSLPWIDWLLLAGAGVVTFRPLTRTWNSDPNYSFGWFIPLAAVFLFAERWAGRPARAAAGPVRLVVPLIFWGLLFFAFRLATETDDDWRPGFWVITGLYVGALLGWLRLYGGPAWMRYFAFPVCFLFLGVPWLFDIEYPLVQGLMRWNAVLVAWSLQHIGIFAEPAGNIIQMRDCQLGVEEACSGILSLQASLVIGFLFGEIYRLSMRRRIALVAAAVGLALVGNYLRTFFLALIAFYSDSAAVARWHDTAGYAILAFTALGGWLAAVLLEAGASRPVPAVAAASSNVTGAHPPAPGAYRLTVAIFCAALLGEIGTQSWFAWRESSLVVHPAWHVRWPVADNPKEVAISETTLLALRCDDQKAAQWRDARGWDWSAYWLRYDPKPYTKVTLNWHNPDNCLPSVGLVRGEDHSDFTAQANGIDFLIQPRTFTAPSGPVYVFWIVYALRGDLPGKLDAPAGSPFLTKFRVHLRDMWNGDRGVGMETLEVGISGPPDYAAAVNDFQAGLKEIITTDAAEGSTATGK